MKRYKVICSVNIVHEMVRYEGAAIVHQSEEPTRRVSDWMSNDQELVDSYELYEFTIESPAGCIEGRWRSFGVIPQEVK